MDFGKVIQFMGQQLDALKNIEELLAHDEKQNPAAHTVKPEEIENLKNYVATMKQAAETAKGLAEYYKKLESPPKPAKTPEAEKTGDKLEQTDAGNTAEPGKESEQTEKPKRKKKETKTETPAEPSVGTPAESPAQVPVAAPEPAPEPQANVLDLIASISIDNLQG